MLHTRCLVWGCFHMCECNVSMSVCVWRGAKVSPEAFLRSFLLSELITEQMASEVEVGRRCVCVHVSMHLCVSIVNGTVCILRSFYTTGSEHMCSHYEDHNWSSNYGLTNLCNFCGKDKPLPQLGRNSCFQHFNVQQVNAFILCSHAVRKSRDTEYVQSDTKFLSVLWYIQT